DAFLATNLPYAEHTFDLVGRTLDAYAREWTRGRTDACEATWVRGEQSPERLDARMSCLDGRLTELSALATVYAHADAQTVQNAVAAAESLTLPARCEDAKTPARGAPPPSDPASAARVGALEKTLAEIKAERDAGHFKEALALAASALTDARALGHPELEAQALYLHGELLGLAGTEPKEAESALRDAAWAADRAGDDATRARAWIELLYVVGTLQHRASEVPLLDGQAMAAIARTGGDSDLELGRRRGLATLYREQGRYAESRTELEAALPMARTRYGPDSRQVAWCLNYMAWSLSYLGEPSLGTQYAEQALAMYERVLGPPHPEVGAALNTLGRLMSVQQKFPESEGYHRRAAAIAESAYGPDHRQVAVYSDNLADALTEQKKFPEAIALHLRSLAIYEKLFGPNHSQLVSALLGLGQTYLEAGDRASAREPLERALRLCGDGMDPLFRADVQFELARALEPRDAARARALMTACRDAYQSAEGDYPIQHANIAAWFKSHPEPRRP
ncbi:MAG TPA: tetratricopeptide repeat protein, partial [Polyangiaceae bacterium]|nr:tetratricopeptide repeat protein [Polyangiaceae bacterium]